MADSAFVLADIDKLVQFEKKSEEAIKEFDAIKEKFNDINMERSSRGSCAISSSGRS